MTQYIKMIPDSVLRDKIKEFIHSNFPLETSRDDINDNDSFLEKVRISETSVKANSVQLITDVHKEYPAPVPQCPMTIRQI